MPIVFSFIAANDRPAFTAGLIADLPGADRPREMRWLAQGTALEFNSDLTPDDAKAQVTRWRPLLDGERIDVNAVPAEGRRKALLIADMESTIIEQECLDELAEVVGLRNRIAGITRRAMAGELDFEDALRERVGLLAGLDAEVLEQLLTKRITYMSGARTLVRTMAAQGAWCALVSGGFNYFTVPVAKALGFHSQQANELGIKNGRLTGTVVEPILGRAAKREALERLVTERALPHDASLAVGDGANDLDMLTAAGLGVAYRAKPVVAEAAPARIEHGDLTALLYLQGYAHDDFATD